MASLKPPSPPAAASTCLKHVNAISPTTPSLPNEILMMIITHLTSPPDLLSLALASHHLYSLISPLHLHYRALRCRFRDSDLWKELLSSPAKCLSIHRLAVLDRAGDRAEYSVDWTRHEKYFDRWPAHEAPGQVAPHADDPLAIHHGSEMLCKLAPGFKNLKHLTMYLPAMCFVRLREFWTEVSPGLEGLHLRISFMHPAVMPEHRAQCAQVVERMNCRLRRFSLKIEEYRSEVIERVLRAFARLLRKCDDLEHLCIEVENGASTSYQCAELWKARWLKLVSLDLSGLRMEEVDELDESFDPSSSSSTGHLGGHAGMEMDRSGIGSGWEVSAEQPNIEQFFLALHSLQTLRLDCYAPRTPTIRPDSMPSLQAVGLLGSSLEVQWAMLPTLVSPLSDGSYRPIDSLQWDLKYYPFADERSGGRVFRLFCNHLAKAGTLRQTMLVRSAYGTESFPWVRMFGQAVPGIEHLVIDPDGIMSFETWLQLLSAYPNLITLNPTNNGIHHPFLKPFSARLSLSRASYSPAAPSSPSIHALSLPPAQLSSAGYGYGQSQQLGNSKTDDLPDIRPELGLGMSMSMSMSLPLSLNPDLPLGPSHGGLGISSMSMAVGVGAGVGGLESEVDRREEGMLYRMSEVCRRLRHVDGWVRVDLPDATNASSVSDTEATAMDVGVEEGLRAVSNRVGVDPDGKRFVWRKRDTSRLCERDCCRLRPPYVRERT